MEQTKLFKSDNKELVLILIVMEDTHGAMSSVRSGIPVQS